MTISCLRLFAFCEVFKGYFFLPPPAAVTPCVDSRKAYDSLAKAIESIHDVRLHFTQTEW